MPLERGAVHISGGPAGDVEGLTIGIEQTSQRRQQRVGCRSIRSSDTRQPICRDAVLTVAHAEGIHRYGSAVIVRRNSDSLPLKTELDGMSSANVGGVVGIVVSVGGAALIL